MKLLLRFIPSTRFLLWLSGSLVTLVVLFHAWMNYSGATRWQAVQERFKKEGETLDFRATLAPPVPEEKNFGAIPPLKDLALVVDEDPEKGEPGAKRKRLKDVYASIDGAKRPQPRPAFSAGSSLGKPADLKAWAEWLRKSNVQGMPPDSGNPARDILTLLSRHDDLFKELVAGLDRQEARWTPEWKTRDLPEMLFAIQVPYYSASQALGSVLALRATAAARAGDAVTAHQSLRIELRLVQASLDDSFLIGSLVAGSQLSQTSGALWEVCDAHLGSVEDFRRLQHEIERFNFEASFLKVFRSELASAVTVTEWLKRGRDVSIFGVYEGEQTHPNFLARTFFKLIPSGWFDMNAATTAELELDYVIKPLRDQGLRGAFAQMDAFDKELKRRKASFRLDSVFATLMAPTFSTVMDRGVYLECLTRQATIACALERWFMEHHEYPDSLDALKGENGKPLLGDVMTGKPMGYRKTPDGKYLLWCVGFDGVDDGGKRVLDPKKPDLTKFSRRTYKGDWLWSYQPG